MGPKQKLAREVLRASDGLTVEQVAQAANIGLSRAYRIINAMPDAYIDRWIKRGNITTAVWCVVIPPPNCPRPESRRSKK
jgi:hypothetical protein